MSPEQYQCGKTILHSRFLARAAWHLSDSVVKATMCVTCLVMALEYKPPIARTPPMMASESPTGKSAQHTIRPEKNIRGSGLYCREFASLALVIDAVTHSGFTIALSDSVAASYSGKSIVFVIMCVTEFRGIMSWLSDGLGVAASAPLSNRAVVIY